MHSKSIVGRPSRHLPFLSTIGLGISMIALTASAPAVGAGFYIKEQGVTGLGRAFAGESAVAEDASTIFFNPAGMTHLDRPEVQANAHLLIPETSMTDRGTTQPTGWPTGGDGGNPYDPSLVPNLYGALPVTESGDLWVGIGLSAPFGLSNEYDDDWFGRYDSIKTSLTTINVAPSVAWQPNEYFSIGAGLDVQHADAELSQVAVVNPGVDGLVTVKGDTTSLGFNIGAIVTPVPGTRIGVHYRSAVSHDLDGTVTLNRPAGAVQSDGNAELDLPDIVAVGIAHEATDRLTLLAEYNHYGWSRFEEIAVEADNPALSAVTPQNYKNSHSISLGAQYDATEALTVRGGLQYDTTPTRDGFRSSRTPDGDRTWISGGLSYDFTDDLTADLAYTYIDISSETLDLSRPQQGGLPPSQIDAEIESDVHIVAAGLRYQF